LAYASIGDEGCHALARFLRDNALLQSLDLRGNNIRADGIVVVAHALQVHQTLKSICFKWNHIGSHIRGIQALCDVLKENTTIMQVDIRNNKIGVDGARVIADMIRENTAITHLDISWNDFGVEGGHALLEGIQMNNQLVDCQLSGNRIAEDTLHAIAFILRRNRTNLTTQVQHQNEQQHAPDTLNEMRAAADKAPEADAGEPGRELGVGQPAPGTLKSIQDEEIQLKLLQRERDFSNASDARFFAEVAEYIDLLQLDVTRNKKYRSDAEERERVVMKGFMEREMRYAQEMRELEELVAKATTEKEELVKECEYLQSECDRVKKEKNSTVDERQRLEETSRAGAERLRMDIRDGLAVKADLETEIYKLRRQQQEQDAENQRLRAYLARCKDDLEKALRPEGGDKA
jgi:hypothetical protein